MLSHDALAERQVELLTWSKQILADYKYPRIIEFRAELPINATGKVLKSVLRQE